LILQSTRLIVFRKTPFQESSLIIAGLSPEFGRLDFMAKGARRVGAKQFPVVDIFRELQVEFKNRASGLHSISKAELIASCDAVASYPENYFASCRLGSFLLKNSHPMLPCPKSYAATRNALLHYAQGDSILPWDSLARLVFLWENGLLPDQQENIEEREAGLSKKRFVSALLSAACGEASLPDGIRRSYWPKFTAWVDELCRTHELQP